MTKIANYLCTSVCFGAKRLKTNASKAFILTLACLLLFNFHPQASAQFSHDDPAWVTTWTTSPSTLPSEESTENSLNNQTVRLITNASIGGSFLRIRLSNVHGDRPVHIGSATVGLQLEGADLVDGTNRTIRFARQDSIVIPPGATVVSDIVNFFVPQTGNLAFSFYVTGESGVVSTHALSNQTNYVSPMGDFTDSISFDIADETAGWPYLTAIDVLPSQPVTAIVTLGDSITDGWGSTDSANARWPNFFARRLYNDDSIEDFAVVNAGISGNRVTTEFNPRFGQNLQARYERDVLALSNVSHIILLEGINDIGMSAGTETPITAEEIITGYRQIITRAHMRGIKVIGATLLPYEGAAYYSEAGNETRQAVNEFIRSSGEFDGVIEFDRAVQDPTNPNRIRAEFTADNLHPNDDGYRAMAEFINLDLFRQ